MFQAECSGDAEERIHSRGSRSAYHFVCVCFRGETLTGEESNIFRQSHGSQKSPNKENYMQRISLTDRGGCSEQAHILSLAKFESL